MDQVFQTGSRIILDPKLISVVLYQAYSEPGSSGILDIYYLAGAASGSTEILDPDSINTWVDVGSSKMLDPELITCRRTALDQVFSRIK